MTSRKIFLRTFWADSLPDLWETDAQRAALKDRLNALGFYVLTGAGDSLDVYALEYFEPIDIRAAKKVLDTIEKTWYTLLRKH